MEAGHSPPDCGNGASAKLLSKQPLYLFPGIRGSIGVVATATVAEKAVARTFVFKNLMVDIGLLQG